MADDPKNTAPPAPPAATAPVAAPPAPPKPRKPPSGLMLRVSQTISEFKAQIGEVWRGLFSSDPLSRRMAIVFVASILGGVLVFGISAYRVKQYYAERRLALGGGTDDEDKRRIADFMAKRSEEGKRRYSTLSIGKFVVEIKPESDAPVAAKGVIHLAEMELVVQCDDRDTCFYIEDHLTQAQNQISDALNALEREELFSREGKAKVRKAIITRLNSWLPKGKIEEVFVPSLIVS